MDLIRDVLNTGWASSIIGLLGVALAVIIYRASLTGARPVYQRRALRLIGADERAFPPEVEIRFRGQAVDRLTKTYIVVWNSGRILLRAADIVTEDPLRAEFSAGARVLDVRVAKVTRTTNKFSVELDPNTANRVVLTFDYLDPGDGAVVEILHTDSKRYPDVKGTIRGVPKGPLDWGRIPPQRTRDLPFPFARRRTVIFAGVLLGFLGVATGAVLPDRALQWILESGNPPNLAFFRKALIAFGLFYAALPLLLLWLTRRRFPRGLQMLELEE